jgi:glutathione S-transferase
MMKLYTFAIAPNPRRIALLMRYKGIEIETQTIDLAKGEQFQPSFKAINPECTVPVLVLDDGSKLTECIEIALYLDSVYPTPPLFGGDALQRARVVGWCHRIFMNGLVPVAEILRNQSETFVHRAMPGRVDIEQIPALIERGQKRLASYFDVMDEYLTGRKYIVGDSLTMADIDALVVIDFSAWVKAVIPDHCRNVQDWYQRTAQELGL